ncbi:MULTISPECIES: 3-deoxy-D-manno-octulosonic acid kinase [Pseudoalteromonas]|uniref:3-deoxy-D-manno-octulosonic acid kinase n=1 Tax=Pseudoalteromonas luteoviolacea (strain 2ta16) TaxID=1353533 RepID=V4HTA3_PSEL2|nr:MULTISPECIES: 3-deoxy-D-manno-octulosonic acid kinase [Pseudoalteromonas]ESP93003.1 Mn2+-dependent serine/threonine protein kinase [Pseudoalteromonas luteoviolacea 2ta16]KZN43185.1 hypothetical protein N483_09705 [Pseudoalteromonas luteoviolacea NCIMB 1944]MCG7549439.1 3-deoxy-D-manno-octulosonic acid kinase [Pseudoalteromonas sp. Of7M-16]
MLKIEHTNNSYILQPQDCAMKITHNWFNVEYWRQKEAIITSKQGRAPAWFIEYQESQVGVLKHYWRGGLIGRLLSDQYLFVGLTNTRVYKEFKLLTELKALDLPVPAPIAAYVEIRFGIYRADILTEAITGAKSLCEILRQRVASNVELQAIGRTIAKFHNNGVYHDDLNINNILFDKQGVVHLIDFDKGDIREQEANWQQANIDRLARSFKKEASKWPAFFFEKRHWQILHNAYKTELSG